MLAEALAAGVACVGVAFPDCTVTAGSLADALKAETGVVRLGPGGHEGDLTAAHPVEIDGSEGTFITGGLELTGATVVVTGVRIEGPLRLGAGEARLADLDLADVELAGGTLSAAHLTVMGDLVIEGGTARLSSTAFAESSSVDEDAELPFSARVDDPRAVSGSPLVDAGDPAPLAPFEPFEDAAGAPRVTDGDGDGVLRRDIGAYEAQPSPYVPSAQNVLFNGGAEFGLAGWSGDFTAEDYGEPLLPSRRAGQALGGQTAFFSGAGVEEATLFQRIDVANAATSIDAGLGRATLSGIVGGYGADPDSLLVEAVFKDPEGATLGRVALAPVTAADRLHSTNLLPRSELAAIPPRTRAIDVLLHGRRAAGGYTDAYADSLALVLSVPGVPVGPPVEPTDPPVDGLRPFEGVAVLTAQPRFTRGGLATILLACADTTVGACRGTLSLRGRLPGLRGERRIGRVAGFTVRRGTFRAVTVRLFDDALRRLIGKGARPAEIVAESFDGQGLRRRATVPVSLVLPARRG